jgi:hypothetical protein
LRKDHHRPSLFYAFFSLFHDHFEVVTGIFPADCYAVEMTHDVAEKGNIEKGLLDDEAEIYAGTHKRMKDCGLKEAHVVADDDGGSAGFIQIARSAQMKPAAAASTILKFSRVRIVWRGLRKNPAFSLASRLAEKVEIAEVERRPASCMDNQDSSGCVFRCR